MKGLGRRQMSALGQKQTCAVQTGMSALAPISTAKANFRKRSSPLYPRKRTCAVQLRMSALGQKRTCSSSANRGSTFVAVQPGLKNVLQAGLSFFWFLCMHSVIRGTSGIVSRQRRKASSLHARRCSGVPSEKLGVENVPIDATNTANLTRRKPLLFIR